MVETVDWPGAIERNREALLRIVAALFVLAGLGEGRATLPRHLRNHVLRILRPAESAVRRLIVIAARNMSADVPPIRSVILGPEPKTSEAPSSLARTHSVKSEPGAKTRNPCLPLIDPLKRFHFGPRRRYSKSFPRITCIGLSEPAPIPDGWFPSPDDEVGARGVFRRLTALKRALDDLDGQAKRLARWKARRDAKRLRFPRFSPMRPGWPPGFRKRPAHEIDDILRDLHSLAVYARKLDTS